MNKFIISGYVVAKPHIAAIEKSGRIFTRLTLHPIGDDDRVRFAITVFGAFPAQKIRRKWSPTAYTTIEGFLYFLPHKGMYKLFVQSLTIDNERIEVKKDDIGSIKAVQGDRYQNMDRNDASGNAQNGKVVPVRTARPTSHD